MFLAETLATLVTGMTKTFDANFAVEEFRDLHVSIEYPVERQQYPSIWVDFEPQGPLSTAGIDHHEFATVQHPDDPSLDRWGDITRWTFEGQATFTLVTMTALSRARLVDEVIRTLGFGRSNHGHSAFHQYVDSHELISLTVVSDTLSMRGMSSSPGTPWGTDDVIYEVTLAAGMHGEFTSDPTGNIVPLSEVHLYATPEGQSPSPEPDGLVT